MGIQNNSIKFGLIFKNFKFNFFQIRLGKILFFNLHQFSMFLAEFWNFIFDDI